MGLPTKHFAGLAGLMLVGVTAFFLVFLPELDKSKFLTLQDGMWISVGLTIASFICFWIERRHTAEEEDRRDKAENKRDKLIEQILENQNKQTELIRILTPEVPKQPDRPGQGPGAAHRAAHEMYKEAAEATSQSVKIVQAIAKKAISKTLDILDLDLFRQVTGLLGSDSADISSNVESAAKLREIADSLALSASTEMTAETISRVASVLESQSGRSQHDREMEA
jgi:hypothetical protein